MVIPEIYRDELMRRLDEAVTTEALSDQDTRMLFGSWSRLLEILFPEEHGPVALANGSTSTAPKTEERIRVYAERVKKKEAIFHPADAQPARGKSLHVWKRGKGNGEKSEVEVFGWVDEATHVGADEVDNYLKFVIRSPRFFARLEASRQSMENESEEVE